MDSKLVFVVINKLSLHIEIKGFIIWRVWREIDDVREDEEEENYERGG